MVDNWKSKLKNYDEYDKEMRDLSKKAPRENEVDDAIAEFEKEWLKMTRNEKATFLKEIKRADDLSKDSKSEKKVARPQS